MNEPFATALASFVAHAQSKVDQNNAEMQSKFPAPRISAMEPGPNVEHVTKHLYVVNANDIVSEKEARVSLKYGSLEVVDAQNS